MTSDNALAGTDVQPSATFALRDDGVLALTDDAVYVTSPGEDTSTFSFEDVVEVRYSSYDWFIAVTSLALVGFGLYSTTEHFLGGLAFAAAGVVSLYFVHRKRGKLTFKVTGRAKPLNVYPEDPQAAYDALDPLVEREQDE